MVGVGKWVRRQETDGPGMHVQRLMNGCYLFVRNMQPGGWGGQAREQCMIRHVISA